MLKMIKTGTIYQHYKGGYYQIIGLAQFKDPKLIPKCMKLFDALHTETMKKYIIVESVDKMFYIADSSEDFKTDPCETFVFYKTIKIDSKHDLGQKWLRPYDMFFSKVKVDKALVDRFKEVPQKI